jgi:hypothetical protein
MTMKRLIKQVFVLATLNTIQSASWRFEYKDIVILTRKRDQGIAMLIIWPSIPRHPNIDDSNATKCAWLFTFKILKK